MLFLLLFILNQVRTEQSNKKKVEHMPAGRDKQVAQITSMREEVTRKRAAKSPFGVIIWAGLIALAMLYLSGGANIIPSVPLTTSNTVIPVSSQWMAATRVAKRFAKSSKGQYKFRWCKKTDEDGDGKSRCYFNQKGQGEKEIELICELNPSGTCKKEPEWNTFRLPEIKFPEFP